MNKAEIVKEFAAKLPDALPDGFEYGPVITVNHPGEFSIYSVRTVLVPPAPKKREPAPAPAPEQPEPAKSRK